MWYLCSTPPDLSVAPILFSRAILCTP
jgi:hypothetical protein